MRDQCDNIDMSLQILLKFVFLRGIVGQKLIFFCFKFEVKEIIVFFGVIMWLFMLVVGDYFFECKYCELFWWYIFMDFWCLMWGCDVVKLGNWKKMINN